MVYTPKGHRWDDSWKASDYISNEEVYISSVGYFNVVISMTILVLVLTTWWLFRRWIKPRNFTSTSPLFSSVQSTVDYQVRSEVKEAKPIVTIYIDALFDKDKKVVDLERANCRQLLEQDLPEGFLDLCKNCKAIFLSKVDSDEEEALVLRFLKTKLPEAFWQQVELPLYRILFSSSTEGRVSMVRQINPTIHLDTEQSVVTALTGRISNLVYVKPATLQTTFQDCASVIKSFV